MALKCGIIGLPNVGKSMFFNALCQQKVLSQNFPFCTIEPNESIVPVPDKRLEQLNEYVQSSAIIPTFITFVDIAGLVKGASKGEGLGNKFLATIREADLLIHIVRCFEDDNVIHVHGRVDSVTDQETINQELRLADLIGLEKRAQKLAKFAKAGKKEAVEEFAVVQRFIVEISKDIDGRNITISNQERYWVTSWQLLTTKPVIYVANVDEKALYTPSKHVLSLQTAVGKKDTQVIPICIALVTQIMELPQEERQAYLDSYDLNDMSLHTLIQAAYRQLGLITYFTVGPKEVRAWTIPAGTLAPQAAGVIHSDFERGFIKAEVISLADFLHYTTREKCRQAGKVTIQGKGYEVQDGDIVHFRFNV